MNILLYNWTAYNMHDLREGLLKKGCQVDTFTYSFSSIEKEPDFLPFLEECLKQKTYDFVMSINYFPAISDTCNALSMKYVSWTCDSPLLALYTKSVFNPCNYIFSFDQWVYEDFRLRGVKNIYYLPLAVNTSRLNQEVFAPDSFTKEEKKKYQTPIAFVGNLYERNSYDDLTGLPDYLQGYLDAVIQAQLKVPSKNFLEEMISEDIEIQLGKLGIGMSSDSYFGGTALLMATTFLGFKTTSVERHTLLNAISRRHKLSLYTNSNTDDMPFIKNCGKVDYLTEMPKVFRCSKINLNITLRTIRTGIPLRIFDVMGAGGFLLTNFQPELAYFFKNKEDLVWYTDQEDMMEKLEYYLSHEKERKAIAEHGYETISRFHTYDARLDQLLEKIPC